MRPDCFVVHYHEIALKGQNRVFFERKLRQNILWTAGKLGIREVRLLRGRILVFPTAQYDIDGLIAALKNVFGIAYFAPAYKAAQDPDAITEIALKLADSHTFSSFRISTQRAKKTFPMGSVQLNSHIGTLVQKKTGARVDLKKAEFTIFIEIFDSDAILYCERIEGAGGLPVGVSNTAAVLLSSGIDSPVAAYKIMRRGVNLVFVHFHSMPVTSAASVENTKRLVQRLARHQKKAKLYLVPFLEIQQHITSLTPPSYRVLLYRRMMMRIAEKFAFKNKGKALVTGENVGQVASQTLPNMLAINEVAHLPVLRPLAGDDKQDIINFAQKIGTFAISIEPYDDCCSLFVPDNPETSAKPDKIMEYEQNLPIDQLVKTAVKETEMIIFGKNGKDSAKQNG